MMTKEELDQLREAKYIGAGYFAVSGRNHAPQIVERLLAGIDRYRVALAKIRDSCTQFQKPEVPDGAESIRGYRFCAECSFVMPGYCPCQYAQDVLDGKTE